MIKIKKFRYQGINGAIISSVLLEGINKTVLYELKAEEGHVLTNGEDFLDRAIILETDLDKWTEIEDNSNK